MRKLLRIVSPLVVGLLMLPSIGHATTPHQVTYVAAGAVSFNLDVHRKLPMNAGEVWVAPMGGFSVSLPENVTTFTLKVADQSGLGTPYTVCQSNNTPTGGFCGDGTQDKSYDDCSTNATKTYSGFVANNSISVFIFASDAGVKCEGTGTEGTATVTY